MTDARPPWVAIPPLREAAIAQVGILVEDVDRSVERYLELWPAGAWSLWTYDDSLMDVMSYRGAPASFAMRLALSTTNPQIELIQSLAGPSIYEEWLAERGFGLHHVGIRVPDLHEATVQLADLGRSPIQAASGYGLDGDGGFAYFDTTKELGVLVELIELPKRRREPDRVLTGL